MMTEIEHKIILDEMGDMYFKRNIRYLRLYMEKYSITYRNSIKYNKVTIKYGNASTYMGEIHIMVQCDDGTNFFSESIPINNLELFKLVTIKK